MFFKLFKSAAALLTAASGTDAASASDVPAMGFTFEPDNFLQALPTIGICMLAIFCVMLIIIISTALINKLGNISPKKKTDDAQ